ncbi:hypothetical protein C0966_17245 (plasmid) [Bacillus methanolicus]|uniref:hypothetical protein n=1 Tax=Bacillus methanolicus TaxID=1471 RepID=UPI002380BCED|nr:hypothetical protein [Bacillus methanolicus]MDE3841012.1 hypothetical protein [Bacillus methanolicus]
MRWQFELTDVPKNAEYPIEAFQIGDNGVRRGPFYYRVEDIITALQQTPENAHDADALRDEEHSTPVLPRGTIRYSRNNSGTKQRVTMVLDKKMWEIRYGEEDEFFTIGFPRMILQYLVVPANENGFRISEMRIYSIQDNGQPVTEDTPLFTFPYPNVSKSNGIVCWGQNERLHIHSLVELERAFRWFVAAPFNEDHGVRTTHGINRFRTLIEKIREQSFEDDWLMPSNKVFGDLFNNK